ncbi:MAG: DNA polymerase sliding clamp [Desulfurococcaceae archaeon]
MFKALYPNANKLKKLIQALAKLSDELPFYVTNNGIEIKVLSPDKTMLAIATLSSLEFEELSVEEETTFIVSTTELKKIIRRATRNDVVFMTINKESNELVMVFRDKKTGVEREFGIPIIPKPPEPIPELQLDLSVSFTMLSHDFKDIVGDLNLVGEEAVFMYENGAIIIKSVEQQKEYECILREGAPLILLTSNVDKARASYNIEMLIVAARAASASKNVTISFDTDKPIKIEYDLAGGGKLAYWIVPRI